MNTAHRSRRLALVLCASAAACSPPALLEDVVTDSRAADARSDARSDTGTRADSAIDAAAEDATAEDAANADVAAQDSTLDAAADSALDVAIDARADAALDASPDVAIDARLDATPDAAIDARPDAAVDAGGDAGVDAGVDVGVDVFVADTGLGAPTVIATTPADGAMAHPTTIAITFSTPMTPATLTAQTAAGACAGSVQLSRDNFATCEAFASAAPVLSAGATVATLAPRPGLLANQRYKLRVTTAARNVADLPLAATFTHATGFFTVSTTALNESGDAAEIDYCNLQFPSTITAAAGGATPVYSRLYRPGLTEPAGAPAGLTAQLGVGPANTNPQIDLGWTWIAASFNVQVGNDDEFQASLVAPAAAGTYRYTFRYSLDGGARWTYCDTNGAGRNGGLDFELANMGTLTVTP